MLKIANVNSQRPLVWTLSQFFRIYLELNLVGTQARYGFTDGSLQERAADQSHVQLHAFREQAIASEENISARRVAIHLDIGHVEKALR